MKKTILLIGLIISFSLKAQDKQNFDKKMNLIIQRLDSIVKQKNNELKLAFQKIDKEVKKQIINKDEAEKKKKEIAKKYADDLDYIVFKLTSQIKNVVKNNDVVKKIIYKDNSREISYTLRVLKNNTKKRKNKKKRKKTYSEFNISFGINNIIANNNPNYINDSPYGIWQSRYFSFGNEWKTSITRNNTFLYFTYGFNLSWNTVKPKNNKYHIVNNDQIQLINYPDKLEYSKLRTRWLQIPIGLELHIPNSKYGYIKLKAGGYAKINIVTKQKLKLTNGKKIIDKQNYNINNFNYGILGEIGGTDWSLIINYDLLNFFKSKNWKHFSLGLKLEL